jgi:RNA recognition motif-containing protein
LLHRLFRAPLENKWEYALPLTRKRSILSACSIACQFSRYGESSGELSSVMILDPKFGNSLKIQLVRTVKHHMSNKLFVGNLSFNTTENDLQDAFAAHGTVIETNLMMDRATGRPRGFGFVTMSTNEEAEKAVNELNGKSLDGRPLTVNVARPREDRGPSGGGGGGGGRRQYGGGRDRY